MVRRLHALLSPTLIVVLALALPSLASASTAGPPMPWDTGLQNLVDNLTGTVARLLIIAAIVVAEAVQWHIDRGADNRTAALTAVRELWVPLLAATDTTLAAFIPMLLAVGNVGNFTRAIPQVIMLTLGVSYLFAVFVTPVLAARFLRRRRMEGVSGDVGVDPRVDPPFVERAYFLSRRRDQSGMLRCRARPTARASSGTSWVITEPAPVVAPRCRC